MSVQCGNPSHPDGSGHSATPLPYYPGLLAAIFTRYGRRAVREEWRQRRNAKRWGCRCHARKTP